MEKNDSSVTSDLGGGASGHLGIVLATMKYDFVALVKWPLNQILRNTKQHDYKMIINNPLNSIEKRRWLNNHS